MEENKKVENLLVFILLNQIKEESLGNKAEILNKSGFSHSEVAELLSTTAQTIRQLVYQNKKTKNGKRNK